MPATKNATKNDTAPETTVPEVEDGSGVVEGADYGLIRRAGSAVVGNLIAALDTADGASLAGALLMLIIARSITDADGFPVWSKGDWPETATALFNGMLSDAGLSEDDGKRFTDAVRASWSRSTGPCNVRDAGIALYVRDQVSGSTMITTDQVSPQQQLRWNAALETLGEDLAGMLPEEMQAGPYNVATVSAPIKKAAAEQLHHFKLKVPVRFGGTPKDSSDTQAKLPASVETSLIDTATQAISGHVGTEGGSTFLSVVTGDLGVGTAIATEIVAASEITDRAKVLEVLKRRAEVDSIAIKFLDGKGTAEDAERLSAVGFLPEQDS